MHLLLDARKIRDGGIGTYIRNLLGGLLENGDTEIGVICSNPDHLPEELRSGITLHVDSTACYSLRELIAFPGRGLLRQYDVFHAPHYTLPFQSEIPAVVTVHDLIHLTHPPKWFHPFIARPLIRSAVRRAKRIVAVSHATADSLRQVTGDASISGKIRVVPNAVAPELVAKRPLASLAHRPEETPRRYLLSVISTAKPHKGVRELIEAFKILKSSANGAAADLSLVVAGHGAHPGAARQFGAPENDDVRFLGEVSQQELFRLYGGATALVVPSRAEGFCLPVLEAQALRIPVVTTPIPAVEDLVTSQDMVAEDFTPRAIAEAIRRSLERNPAFDAEAEAEYTRHLERFDRRRLAREMREVYEEACGGDSQ